MIRFGSFDSSSKPLADPKSGKRLAYDKEERESQIDAMLRRAKLHRERARALLTQARRAKALAARLVKQAKAKRQKTRARKR